MRFYKILQAKQCGNAEGLTAYERQFVEYLKKIDIKTITGVLPLTFTAKGGTAVDWVIYGNDENGTENLFDIGTSASDYVGASIGVEIDGYNLSMNIVGYGGTWTYRNKKISTTGEHTVSLSSDKTYPRVYIALRNQDNSGWLTDSDASISGFAYNSYYHGWYKDNESYTAGNLAISVTIPSCLYWQIGFGFNSSANVGTIGTLSNIMLTKGSPTPDHYIPYQKGVGERTENVLDISKFSGKYDHLIVSGIDWAISNQAVILNSTSTYKYPQEYITDSNGQALQLQEGETYSIKINKNNVPEGSSIYLMLRAMSGGSAQTYDTIRDQKTITISSGWSSWQWLLVVEGFGITYDDCTIKIDVRKSNDMPQTYIPYGYQIPLTVSQSGQNDKTYNIYIGNSPLTEGQQVSKTSTGQDIELFGGENVVDTTLYNKPSMEIKYK